VRRIVLVFGFISGAILSVMMIGSVAFGDRIGLGHSYIVGYTSMVLAFLMVYFGIRSYRDNVSGGAISFGKAFVVGICITLIACLCYVATWELVYDKFYPDFMEKYSTYVIEKARAAGATQAQLDAKTLEMRKMTESYRNPFYRMAWTFIEAFPVGLLFTLVSSGLLRRKRQDAAVAASAAVSPAR
jgi:ABC-type polysaccharide/polyol phosphate export permease